MQADYELCPLCCSESKFFAKTRKRSYFQCKLCSAVFMQASDHLSIDAEKKRYLSHNNDVEDKKYQDFVSPLVNSIRGHFSRESVGLDFGAGTGPVSTKLLEDNGYNVNKYDPFFWKEEGVLKLSYDFIFACEVIEHFRMPKSEFKLMRSLLKKDGILFCMSSIYSESIDFENWYYKNDPTHVFFYHKKTLDWIRENFHFREVLIQDNLIRFIT